MIKNVFVIEADIIVNAKANITARKEIIIKRHTKAASIISENP